jgi:hypothetical protein
VQCRVEDKLRSIIVMAHMGISYSCMVVSSILASAECVTSTQYSILPTYNKKPGPKQYNKSLMTTAYQHFVFCYVG